MRRIPPASAFLRARPRWCIFLLAAVCVLPGCGDKPQIAPISSRSVVLVFGDSITFGTGAARDASYPAVLESMLGCTVINAGYPGEVTKDAVKRLPGLLDARRRPDLLVLCHGGNDMLQGRDRDLTKQNLDNMVKAARSRGVDVVLVGVPTAGLLLKVPPFYEEIAKKYDIPYEGKVLRDILSDRKLKSDHIHPNAEGYKRLAHAIAEVIRGHERESNGI